MTAAPLTGARVRPSIGALNRSRGRLLALFGIVLIVLCLLSIAIGARPLSWDQLLGALSATGDAESVKTVWSSRMPRTGLGLLIGAGLGVAGGLMQALTRNPLADPGLLGISAGAAFAVVLSVAVFSITTLAGFIWFAFAGAFLAGAIVYVLGGLGRGGHTPVKLALAGVSVSALLGALTSGVILSDTASLERYRFWAAGSLAGLDMAVLKQVAPFLLIGLVLALAMTPKLNSLALGDEVAASLGRRIGLIRLQGAVAVTLLAGAAVAACGPIVFIGLIVPLLARIITGPDYRWLLAYTMVLSPCLLLGADVLGRVLDRPSEINVGLIVALIGGPSFIAVVRRRRLAEL